MSDGPVAATVKLALLPPQVVVLTGCDVMADGVVTVSVTAAEVTLEGQELLTITRYLLLFIPAVTAVRVKLAALAPAMLLKVAPPSVLSCH